MKKTILSLIVTAYLFAGSAQASTQVDGYDAFIDALFLRPIGLVGLVAGTAAFVAVSPFAAIASIPKPHNAFPELSKTLIVRPAKYTFVRPVGDYNYH